MRKHKPKSEASSKLTAKSQNVACSWRRKKKLIGLNCQKLL